MSSLSTARPLRLLTAGERLRRFREGERLDILGPPVGGSSRHDEESSWSTSLLGSKENSM